MNGKVYIGQSVDPKKRFRSHVRGQKDWSSLIHSAIVKYGEDNFRFEVIEHGVEDYNEREKYWIAYYRSNEREYGYNLTPGGEDAPTTSGYDSPLAKFTDDEICAILNALATDMSYTDLSMKYHVSVGYIQALNNGTSRPQNGYHYPIRHHANVKKSDEQIKRILHELAFTTKSTEQIAREQHVDSLLVYYINKGKEYADDTYTYPIRQDNESLSSYMLDAIIHDLQDCKLKFADIEQYYKIGHATLSRLNNGKIYKRDYLKYPIRTSSQRVY